MSVYPDTRLWRYIMIKQLPSIHEGMHNIQLSKKEEGDVCLHKHKGQKDAIRMNADAITGCFGGFCPGNQVSVGGAEGCKYVAEVWIKDGGSLTQYSAQVELLKKYDDKLT